MSILYAPTKALLEPNLLVPHKKPVGNVRIDYDHPFAHKLGFCSILQGNGKNIGTDGGDFAIFGANSGYGVDKHGQHYRSTVYNTGSYAEADYKKTTADETRSHTLVMDFTFTGEAPTAGIWTWAESATSGTLFMGIMAYDTTTLRVYSNSNYWLYSHREGLSLTIGQRYVLHLVYDYAANTHSLYVDGEFCDEQASIYNLGTRLGSRMYLGSGYNKNTTTPIYSILSYRDYAMPLALIKDQVKDLYQFLKPAGMETEVTSVGRGGAIAEVWHRMMSWL